MDPEGVAADSDKSRRLLMILPSETVGILIVLLFTATLRRRTVAPPASEQDFAEFEQRF